MDDDKIIRMIATIERLSLMAIEVLMIIGFCGAAWLVGNGDTSRIPTLIIYTAGVLGMRTLRKIL